MVNLPGFFRQLLNPKGILSMRRIVAIQTVLRVELCVLANVFDVRRGLWCGCWPDHVWAREGQCEIATEGGIETAGHSAIDADVRCFSECYRGHGEGVVGVFVDCFAAWKNWDSAASRKGIFRGHCHYYSVL